MTITRFCLVTLAFASNILVDKRALQEWLRSNHLLGDTTVNQANKSNEESPLLDNIHDEIKSGDVIGDDMGELNPKMTSSFLADKLFTWFTP